MRVRRHLLGHGTLCAVRVNSTKTNCGITAASRPCPLSQAWEKRIPCLLPGLRHQPGEILSWPLRQPGGRPCAAVPRSVCCSGCPASLRRINVSAVPRLLASSSVLSARPRQPWVQQCGPREPQGNLRCEQDEEKYTTWHQVGCFDQKTEDLSLLRVRGQVHIRGQEFKSQCEVWVPPQKECCFKWG